MRKIYIMVLIALAAFTNSYAQGKIARMWSNPAAFKADEEVTLFFDVSGTSLAGQAGPLYLWTWNPGDPAQGNGTWDNSPEHMKLTQVQDNVWSFTMTPTIFYGKSVEEITQIFGLLKSKDGSLKTDDFKEETGDAIVLYDFSAMANNIIDIYPADFKGEEPVSIILNVANAWSEGGTSQGQLVGKQPAMHSGINNWQNEVPANDPSKKQLLTLVGDNIWKIDFIPHEYYGTTDVITEINLLFNDDGDWTSSARDVAGENFKLTPKLPGPEPEKEYKWFPQMFTMEDIVTFYFNPAVTENEFLKTASEVYYTITANGVSIDGKTKKMNDGRFKVSLIPARILANPETVTSMEFVFRNVEGTETSEVIILDNKNLIPIE